MASLKDLKNRIGSVKSTQKITKAMKMVAAAKLRKATERAEQSRPYATHMENMVRSVSNNIEASTAPKMLVGTGKKDTHLIVVMSSDRGLCGGFNSSICRSVRDKVTALQAEGKTVKIFCVGRKGFDQLNPLIPELIIGKIFDVTKNAYGFAEARELSEKILDIYEDESFDTCTIVFNAFKSAISQIVTYQQLIPLQLDDAEEAAIATATAGHEYEPEEEVIMEDLLPRNISIQIFKALLENTASEQGARMTAMDNATRNAGDMIKDLTLLYNRTRQAAITKELIEIISGAEAV